MSVIIVLYIAINGWLLAKIFHQWTISMHYRVMEWSISFMLNDESPARWCGGIATTTISVISLCWSNDTVGTFGSTIIRRECLYLLKFFLGKREQRLQL